MHTEEKKGLTHTDQFMQGLPAPILIVPRSRDRGVLRYTVERETPSGCYVAMLKVAKRESAITAAAHHRDTTGELVRIVDEWS